MRSQGNRDRRIILCRGGRGGFTLLEAVIGTAITAILAVAIGSAILIASHALPDSSSPVSRIVEAGQVADQIARELQYAVHITERSASGVTFTVADRDGDGSPEVIRYGWSGVSGDPLTRQYNHGAVVDVLEDVHQFELAYALKSVTEEYPGPVVQGTEQLLESYDGTVQLQDYQISKDNWIGQHFRPSLPAGAVSWRVTRVLFLAKREEPVPGQTLVQLRPADADKEPAAAVLEEMVMEESGLTGSYEWTQFSFGSVGGLLPGHGLCLVLRQIGPAGYSASIQFENDGSQGACGRLTTANAGATWQYGADKAMKYRVYGRAATPGPAQTATRKYVMSVRVALRVGDGPGLPIGTAVHTANAPEVLSAVWECGFDTSPIALDMNGDGSPDWLDSGGKFSPSSLVDGVWHADSELRTLPDSDLAELVTADIAFRCTGAAGSGATFRVNADKSGSTYAPIVSRLRLEGDGTQTLRLLQENADDPVVQLVKVPGLPGGFVKLRLVVDPGLATVSVAVNGRHTGTFPYGRFASLSVTGSASIRQDAGAAEVDYVRVRVGGSNP